MDNETDQDDLPPATPARIELKRDELLPSAQRVYDELVLSSGEMPTIVLSDMLAEKGKMNLSRDEQGKPVFVVTEQEHRWTEEYVRQQREFSDEVLASMTPYENPRVLAAVAEMAKQLGMESAPRLIAIDPKEMGSQGGAELTREGTRFIPVDPKMEPDEIIDMAGHELGHLHHGDPTDKGKVAVHNDETHETERNQERLADATAALLGRGHGLATYIRGQLGDPETVALAREAGITPNELHATAEPTHPPPLTRSQYLQQLRPAVEAELMAQPEQHFGGDNPLANLIHPADIVAFQPLSGGEHREENDPPRQIGEKPRQPAVIIRD